MVSLPHEAPLLLLRERPELLVALLKQARGVEIGVSLPNDAVARMSSAELTQIVPQERRADAVITLERGDTPTTAFVVEVQRARDEEKRWRWPIYLASLHERVRCPTLLVVFALDESVAGWARQPIATMQPATPVAPLVLGPSAIPRVVTDETAAALPELAILSALVHGDSVDGQAIIGAAVRAVGRLDEVRAKNYIDVIYGSLGELARAALEALMSTDFSSYRGAFAQKIYDEGLTRGARRALFTFLAARGITLSASARERIEATADGAELERWTARAAHATREEDLFAG